MSKIKVYGADWCHDTQSTLEHLDELAVDYQYINIEQDAEAARWVREQNDGKERKPTLDIEGLVLSVPGNQELDAALEKQGLI